MSAFNLFQRATGASINLTKSMGLKLEGFVGRKLPENTALSETAIRITLIYFGGSNAVQSKGDLKLEKARVCLTRWRAWHLSLLGKMLSLTLLFPLFYFVGPFFPVPAPVAREVVRLAFNFLWEVKTERWPRRQRTGPWRRVGYGRVD